MSEANNAIANTMEAVDAVSSVPEVSQAPAVLGEVTEGIYEFQEGEGTYVGQSGNIPNRLDQHVSNGRVSNERAASARRTYVPGGKVAREVAEQRRINELGGVKGGKVTNKVNPIGPNRQQLMDGSE